MFLSRIKSHKLLTPILLAVLVMGTAPVATVSGQTADTGQLKIESGEVANGAVYDGYIDFTVYAKNSSEDGLLISQKEADTGKVPIRVVITNSAGGSKDTIVKGTVWTDAGHPKLNGKIRVNPDSNITQAGNYELVFEVANAQLSGKVNVTVRASAGRTIDPGEINMTILSGDGGLPFYKYVVDGKPNLTINLKLRLNSPDLIQEGDELNFALANDPTILGVYLGLTDKAGYSDYCQSVVSISSLTEKHYTSCDYSFDNSDGRNGFKTIKVFSKGIEVSYPITLTYNDLKKLGVQVDNLPATGGPQKDIYFDPVINLTQFFGTATYSDLSLENVHFNVRIVAFNTEAEKNSAPENKFWTQGLFTSTGGNITNTGNLSSGDVKDTIGGALLSVVNIILGIVIGILRWVLWVIGTLIFVPLLETTLSINAANISGPIAFGWTFVRDVVNMIFILGLVVIGFGTILKIESYNYKKLLVNLIMMALLVNFSLVIGRIIIQIADAAQFTFLPQTVEYMENGRKVTGTSGVKYLFSSLVNRNVSSIMEGLRGMTVSSAGALAATFSLIFQLILELMTVVTFGALAVFMLIRTVALWILLILSPLAYGLAILPATASMAKKWWDNFIKYALFAPIIAFFMRLSLELYQNKITEVTKNLPWSNVNPDTVNTFASITGTVSFGDALKMMMEYIIVLAFLWAGMLVTKNMGIAGASAIVNMAQKGIAAPFAGGKWLAGKGVGFAGQKINEWSQKLISEKAGAGRKALFALVNPVAFARGWAERSHERKEQAKAIATGAGQEVAAAFWTRGKEKIPNKELATRKIEREMERKLREAMGDDIDKAEARDFYKRVSEVGGLEGDLLRGAYLKLVVAQGYGDDFTEVSSTAKVADKKHIPEDQRKIYNDKMFQTHAWAMVGLDMNVLEKLRTDKDFKTSDEYKHWVEKDDTQNKLRNLAELTNPAKAIGHYEQMYSSVRDETLENKGIHAAFRPVVDEEFEGGEKERTDMILGETVKIPIRDFMRSITWHNLIPKQWNEEKQEWEIGSVVDKDGNSLLTDYQIAMLKKLGPEYIDQATHMQARTVKYTMGQWVADDGSIIDPVQFAAFRKINAGLADVLKNIAVYGRPRPTSDDIKTVDRKSREQHVSEIIEDKEVKDRNGNVTRESVGFKFDETAREPITKVYEKLHKGPQKIKEKVEVDGKEKEVERVIMPPTHAEAAQELQAAGIASDAAEKIVAEISDALAVHQAGLIVPSTYLPGSVKLDAADIEGLSKAVNEGVKNGLREGHIFGSDQSKSAITSRLIEKLSPILGKKNLASSDIERIAEAMATKANTKVYVTPSGDSEAPDQRSQR